MAYCPVRGKSVILIRLYGMMSLEEALQLVTNIVRDYRGTAKDHELIKTALTIIQDRCYNVAKSKTEVKADTKKE